MTTYDLGDGVNLEHYVYDRDGALTDATVAISVTKPDGSAFTAPAISTVSTGRFRAATFEPDAAGTWHYQWTISGTVTDVAAGSFVVRAVPARGYCSIPDLREHFGDSDSRLTESLLARAINAASRAIDQHCGRRFWQDPEVQVKVFRPADPYEATIDDISTQTGVIVKTDDDADGTYESTWDAEDWQLEPLNAGTDGPAAHAWWTLVALDAPFPTHSRRPLLQVTARYGWSDVPHEVEEACLLRAAAIFKRKEAIFGVAGFNGFGEVRIGRNDVDVVALLHPYVKIRVGAV
jgi:hypothetical protein